MELLIPLFVVPLDQTSPHTLDTRYSPIKYYWDSSYARARLKRQPATKMARRILLLCFIAIHSARADSNGCVCQGDNCDLESTLTDGKSTGTQNNSRVAKKVQINFPSASSQKGHACYLFNGTDSTTSTTYDLYCYELDISYSSSNTITKTVDGVNSTFPGNLSATLGAGNQITGMLPSATTFTTTTVDGKTMICTRTYPSASLSVCLPSVRLLICVPPICDASLLSCLCPHYLPATQSAYLSMSVVICLPTLCLFG